MKKVFILLILIASNFLLTAQTTQVSNKTGHGWLDGQGNVIQGTEDWTAIIETMFYTQKKNRENELVELMNQNPICLEKYYEYKSLLAQCREEEVDDQIVIRMVDFYSTIDFERLEDFDRRLLDCILNIRLKEAHSLVDSKGDIHARREALFRKEPIDKKKATNRNKSKSKQDTLKITSKIEVEDLAKDCYYKAEIFKLQYEWDSAGYYLGIRADLDTSNVEWQLDAGEFGNSYFYYSRALCQVLIQQGANRQTLADCYNHIGDYLLLFSGEDNSYGLDYYFKALSIYKSLFGDVHPSVANLYYKIGKAYHDSVLAIDYYNLALDTYHSLFDNENHLELVQLYYTIGNWYEAQQDGYATQDTMRKTAMAYYLKALQLEKSIYGEKSELMAERYRYLGDKANELNFDVGYKALDLYKKALEIDTINNRSLYYLCQDYERIGDIYIRLSMPWASKYYMPDFIQKEYVQSALNYYKRGYTAIRLYCNEKSFDHSNDDNEEFYYGICSRLSYCYHRLGTVCFLNGDFNGAHSFYLKSIGYYRSFISYHQNDMHDVSCYYYAKTMVIPPLLTDNYDYDIDDDVKYLSSVEQRLLVSIGAVFAAENKFDAASRYCQTIITYLEHRYDDYEDMCLSESENELLADSYRSMALIYEQNDNYELAYQYLDKALDKYLNLSYSLKEIAVCFLHAANMRYNAFEYDDALFFVDEAQSHLKRGSFCYAVCHLLRGDVYLKKSMLEQALNEYELSLTEFDCATGKRRRISEHDNESVMLEYGLALENYQQILSNFSLLYKNEVANSIAYDYSLGRSFEYYNLNSSCWFYSSYYTIDPLLFNSLDRICSLSSEIDLLKSQIKENKY